MSTIAERARIEAEEAEAEFPDDETAEAEEEENDETAPDPEPEPAGEPSSFQTVNDLDKKLASESKRHENALAKLYGEDWDKRLMCPLCEAEGFMLPWPAGTMPDEQVEAVKALAGVDGQADLRQATTMQRCETCDGWGEVLSGAQKEQTRAVGCPSCQGYGYVPTAPPPIAIPNYTQPPAAPMPQPSYPENAGPADAWGRPAGHAHYGIDPKYVVA